jgi:endoglucanase
MSARAPYTIQPIYLARIDQIVMAALGHGLKVQLDAHHYGPMLENPDAETPRFRAMWREIARHYADAPEELSFEPLNEPRGELWTAARVTAMQSVALEEIRASNPTRIVVQGGPNWNSIDGLSDWTPPADAYSVATAHYYEPHAFTHQGAGWEDPPPRYDGQWGNAEDRQQVEKHIGLATSWARAHGMAMQLGEFGVIGSAEVSQRALWTRTVRETCEAQGLGWCVWDFAGAFPVFDLETQRFIPEMLEALTM